MNIGFERISPTPLPASGVSLEALSKLPWTSRSAHVISFKASLKEDLRSRQLGRCCYCRRILPDPTSVHIEHIIEKEAAPSLTFEIINLALSCATCNGSKNSVYLKGGRSPPALVVFVPPLTTLPMLSSEYSWVHPHIDRYSDHLSIGRSWIFRPHTDKGMRLVSDLGLNALVQLEIRALEERMASRSGMLTLLAGAIADSSAMQVRDICSALIREIRRRW